jgi:hypothetical protein
MRSLDGISRRKKHAKKKEEINAQGSDDTLPILADHPVEPGIL